MTAPAELVNEHADALVAALDALTGVATAPASTPDSFAVTYEEAAVLAAAGPIDVHDLLAVLESVQRATARLLGRVHHVASHWDDRYDLDADDGNIAARLVGLDVALERSQDSARACAVRLSAAQRAIGSIVARPIGAAS